VAQVELESAVLPEGRNLDLAFGRMSSADGGSVAVAIPRDDARAFAGVGRGELFAEQRVDERRLSRLHRPHEGDTQWLFGAPAE
jgi:hypothetical protein